MCSRIVSDVGLFSLREPYPSQPHPLKNKTKTRNKKKISKTKTKQRGVANPGSITIDLHLLINILSMMETNA